MISIEKVLKRIIIILGRITWDELKRVSSDLGDDLTDEEIKVMFRKADLDDDGFVTFEDFYNMMTGRVYYDWMI